MMFSIGLALYRWSLTVSSVCSVWLLCHRRGENICGDTTLYRHLLSAFWNSKKVSYSKIIPRGKFFVVFADLPRSLKILHLENLTHMHAQRTATGGHPQKVYVTKISFDRICKNFTPQTFSAVQYIAFVSDTVTPGKIVMNQISWFIRSCCTAKIICCFLFHS